MTGKVIGVTSTGLGGANEYRYTYDPTDPESVATNSLVTAGQETYSRLQHIQSQTMVSGQMRLSYFLSRKSETVTKIRVISGSANSASLTVGKVGLYLLDSSGNGTLVASCANDTALLGVATTAYTKTLSASYDILSGSRYALAVLTIGSTAGSVYGVSNPPAEVVFAPRVAGSLSGQTDLPASFTEAGMGISGFIPYGVVFP
jgi:hypothetical protein